MQDFKREDYIYVRYLEDYDDACKKKGDIARYRKDWLFKELKGRRFKTCFDSDTLIWEKNPEADENEIAFNKIFKSITVSEDWRGEVYLCKDDYLYLDDWLFSHLSSHDIDLIKRLKKEILPNPNGDDKLVKLKEGCPYINARIVLHFNKGETIDFSHPSVMALFYNPYWLKMIATTETIVGEEKEQLFQDDFCNAIYVQAPDDHVFSLDSKKEHHYFKLKDGIKVKTNDELDELLEMLYVSMDFSKVRDESGFITHICTATSSYDNSNRELEQILLKIADRVSQAEALEIHEKACFDYAKRQNIERISFMAELEREQKELNDLYQTKKNDPEIFPGVNGNFIHVDTEDLIVKKLHTLKQIKTFYQNLNTLDPEIVKHICFYGGTVPYILNGASEARDFGDIDMFVPTEYMEQLREEFAKQESFEMLCDSKPYAERCMLTSRISKETHELALQAQQTDTLDTAVSSLFDSLMSLMTPSDYKKDYIDEFGIVHSPFNVHREDELPYYRKIQDFGFKAKLFGINISVFPIYEYRNNLMAKSFNIKEMHKFLLGVRVLDNTRLAEFMRQVNVFGSVFNVLPLEYTLASKQSALEGGYAYRSHKDKKDVEYILSHKDELGISDETLKEILKNYPDYSISIAYEINGNQVTTMDGETYKQFVLTNRQVS